MSQLGQLSSIQSLRITPGHTNIQMQFQIAAGAFEGAGGTLLLDNIIVSQVPVHVYYALILGLLHCC